MTTFYLPYNSESEWLEMRRQDITSTEASALFGMSPYSTAYELWHQKKGNLDGTIEDNDRMQAGRHIEPAIASLVAERYGCSLEPMKVYARDPDDRLGGSFDYSCADGAAFGFPGMRGICEMKNVDWLVHRRTWSEDEAPEHIEIQLQHQLELTGFAWGGIFALVGGNNIVGYVRARNHEVGAAIRRKVREFWHSIDADQAPPIIYPDDADVVIAMNQFAGGDAYRAEDGDPICKLLSEFDHANAAASAAEAAKKIAKAKVLDAVGDASAIFWPGGKVSLTQVADNDGTLITADMIGQTYGARKGYRLFRSTPTKEVK
ncbi:MAG TPA: YqaJ viral recombinase family protein [Gammaproteobacteria bacterium]|nr:YqaJ viral recombinase family protein [Gammaproteobacteria bacterium]